MISSTTIYYAEASLSGCISARTPVTANVFQSKTSSQNTSFCHTFTSPSGKYVWTASGAYQDTLLTKDGCDSVITIVLIQDQVDVSVTEDPPKLTANANPASYQWIDCATNMPLTGDTGKVFTAIANGLYAVVVTQGNCSDTSACFEVTGIGITGQDVAKFRIYPNPASDVLNIDFGGTTEGVTLELRNDLGQTVMEQKITRTNKCVIDLGSLPVGVYSLTMLTKEGAVTHKVIRE